MHICTKCGGVVSDSAVLSGRMTCPNCGTIFDAVNVKVERIGLRSKIAGRGLAAVLFGVLGIGDGMSRHSPWTIFGGILLCAWGLFDLFKAFRSEERRAGEGCR